MYRRLVPALICANAFFAPSAWALEFDENGEAKPITTSRCEGWWNCLSQDNKTLVIVAAMVCATVLLSTAIFVLGRRHKK